MPRSVRFFFRNRWTESDTVVTASDAFAEWPPSQTQTPALSEQWRFPPLAANYIQADFGAQRVIGAVLLAGTDMSAQGQYRITISNTSDFSVLLYDSGTLQRPRYFSDEAISAAKITEFFFDGVAESYFTHLLQPQVLGVELDAEISARYVRVFLYDPAAPRQFTGLSYVYAGKVLTPGNDLQYGWSIQREQVTRSGAAACGQVWSAPVRSKTVMRLSLAPQPELDVLRDWWLIQTLVGINNEFFVSLSDESDALRYATTIFARYVESPTITLDAFKSYGISMDIEEIID